MKMKKNMIETIKCHYSWYAISIWLLQMKTIILGGAKIENHGNGSFKKDIIGSNNTIYVGRKTMIYKSLIRIRGNNNKIIIGENCKIKRNCSFWIQGNNCSIILGNNVSMQSSNHFNAQEDNRNIIIGNDCMFSNNIIVRTSDAHGIFDIESKKRLNQPKDVRIGNHVWIAPYARIFKGSIIDDGAVIGSNTMVTKHIPSNTLAVGMPAKIVKESIVWSRSTELIE